MLETLNQNKINIKDLVLDEPTIGLPFNPERSFSDADWEAIKSFHFDHLTFAADFDLTPQSCAVLLFPDRALELNVGDYWRPAINHLVHQEAQLQLKPDDLSQVSSFIIHSANAALVFPDKRQEIMRLVDKHKDNIMNSYISNEDAISKSFPLFQRLFSISILYPQIIPDIRSNPTPRLNIETLLMFGPMDNHFDFVELIGVYAYYKPLLPEGNNFKMNKRNWPFLNNALKMYKEDAEWLLATNLAFYMKILAADTARIRDNGEVEIIMSKSSFLYSIPSMPQVRKF